MTEPIIVPVSAPGATTAAAEVRQFGATVAQTGVAAEKAAAGHAGHAKGIKAAGDAAEGAAAKNKVHIRTLDEELIRLKQIEEQAHITAAARRKLGESANAADIGAIRRFGRGMGGIGSEIGRGVAEGVEGVEGSGLRSTLGLAGAGMAGGVIAYEGITHAVDAIVEAMHREIEERYKNIALIQEADKRAGDIGKTALDKYGESLVRIAAGGGETSVKNAKEFAFKNKADSTAIEAYEDASKKFSPGSERGLALQAAEMFQQSGGGTLKDAMSKLTPERIARMLQGGTSMASMVGEMYGDEHGLGRLSEDEVQWRIDNRKASPTARKIDTLKGVENATALGGIDKMPQAEGPIRSDAAANANPHAAILHDLDVKDRPEDEKLRAGVALEDKTFSGMGYGFGGAMRGFYNVYKQWGKLFGGSGTANDRLDKHSNEKFDTAEKLMPGQREAVDHLRAAADALERGELRNMPAGATL